MNNINNKTNPTNITTISRLGVCPKCGAKKLLIQSNNPLCEGICFDCIASNLNYTNLEHADFFCRTYNYPFNPSLWLSLVEEGKKGAEVFQTYSELMLAEKENQPNLAYSSSTHDLWAKANKEWEKCRSFAEILEKLQPIKDSYITRGRFKWGEQYTFGDLIKLDSIYTRTLKANNITNPIQKEAVKTLCKLQLEMDEAIRMKDAKAIRDFSNAWSTFAKQADLEQMINNTKTDDITTVAELYQYLEDRGFKLNFNLSFDKDEVDRTIKDLKEAQRRLILESTGLQSLLDEMIHKEIEKQEMSYATEKTEETTLEDLLNFSPEANIDVENDEDVMALNFDAASSNDVTTIIRKEDEEKADAVNR